MSYPPSAPILECRDLSLARGGRDVLLGVSLQLHAGEALALVGPNAAGKSTLVRALTGLLAYQSGEVRLMDRPLGQWSRPGIARNLSLVMPVEPGGEGLTVAERVALGRYPHRGPFGRHDSDDTAAVRRALAEVGILGLAERKLGTLSAGERQLAALARGLAQQPRVLILDEPSAHLDIKHQLDLFRVLDGLRETGVGVLAVVHDLARAAHWADRLVLLARGRVVADGPPADVLLSRACADAFGVRVERHGVAGRARAVYTFDESSPEP